MTDEPDNVVLIYLRRIDKNVSEMREDVRNLQSRMSNVEKQLGELQVQVAETNIRLDHIEKRLDLHDNVLMEAGDKFEGGND